MDDLQNKNLVFRIFWYLPEIIASIALIVTISITGINVFTRYILRFTYFWYTDVTILAFGWLVFCGAAAAYKRHMHFGIDMLVNLLKGRARALFNVLFCLLLTVILVLIMLSGLNLTHNVSGKQLPTILISYKWFDASSVVGFSLMVIYSLMDLKKAFIEMLRVFRGKGAGY